MTRQEWIEKCVENYKKLANVGDAMALSLAKECAEIEAVVNGENVCRWSSPESAVSADISTWELV